MSLTMLLFGNRTVWVPAADRRAVMDICLRESVSYTNFQWDSEGNVSFCCTYATARRLARQCARVGLEVQLRAPRGIPAFFLRYRRRAGLFLGALLASVMLMVSRRFLWEIRITGNETMTRSEVLEELRECGFSVGAYLPDLHTSELENRVLLASDRISWISVNLQGTVAQVQIIEQVLPEESESVSRPANLVAAADGQIELIQLYRGNVMVKVGQAVQKGDLLVSGLYDSQVEGYRYTRAAGKVLARTERSFRVEIPFQYEEKVYRPAEREEILLNFFDFSIKIYKSTGNWGGSCDIIKKEKGLELPGLRELPLGVTVVQRLPYEWQSAVRTPEQATELAYARLEQQLAALSDEIQLLEKKITATMTEDALILECTVKCIEDIAVQAEFEIAE